MHNPRGPFGGPVDRDPELHSALSSRLEQLGYISGPLPQDRETLEEVYIAITQQRTGGAVTQLPEDEREMEDAIIAALDSRFCGVVDTQNTMVSGAPRGRWERGNLTWSVDSTGCNWTHGNSTVNTIEAALWDGLRPWHRAHPDFFEFTKVDSGGDIRFSFSGDTNIGHGSVGSVLATADFPDQPERGRIRFDSAESWTRQRLAAVTEHEMGHCLGLKHSSVPNSTMSPFAAPYGPLDADTVNTLRDMYAWTAPKRFDDNRASSDGPALTTTHWQNFQQSGTRAFIAWNGVVGHNQIFISASDDEGLTWGPQISLDGIRSSHGPAITGYHSSAGSPGQDDVFMAWKGEDADERLFYARGFNGSSFSSIERLEGHTSNARPAVAEFEGRVHMVWKASTGDHVLWASWAGGQWSGVSAVPNVLTSHAPALTVLGNDLVMCWQGMGNDTRLFTARLQGGAGAWSPIQLVTFLDSNAGAGGVISLVGSPVFTSHHPAITAAAGNLVVAYKGQPGDDAVWMLRGTGFVSGPVQIKDGLSSTGPGIAAIRNKVICAWKAQAPDQWLHFAIRA